MSADFEVADTVICICNAGDNNRLQVWLLLQQSLGGPDGIMNAVYLALGQ